MALVLLDKVGGEDDPTKLKLLESVNLGLNQQRGAIAAGLSAGVDQLQGLGYSALGGVADIAGASGARDWANEQARRNQIDASVGGRPDLERIEDQSLGSALPYLGYQISKQVPTMLGIAGAQLIPGAGQVAGAVGLTRLGAIAPRMLGGGGLQAGSSAAARRAALAQGEAFGTGTLAGSAMGFGSLYGESVEGGDPSPFKALALAPIYGAAEAVLPAVLQGSLRAPARYSGNIGTRMAKAGGVAGAGESLTELGQNELEMGMRSDLTAEEMASRRLNAAVAGLIVGGSLGTVGGIRGLQRPDIESDLTKPLDTTTRPDPSQFVTQDQTVGLQKFIDINTGVVRPSRVDYEKQFIAAFDEPSGQFAADAATGIERELTAGELVQRGSTAMDLTQDKPADTAAAATAATKVAATRDPRDVFLRDELKVIPNNNSRQLFSMMEEQGIDPKSPAMVPVWNYAAAKYLSPSRLTKATELMDAAIIQSRKEAASGTGISTVQQPAGGVGVGGPVVQGALGDAGRAAPVTKPVDGGAPAVGAPLQQAGVLSVAPGQPSTTVTQNEVDNLLGALVNGGMGPDLQTAEDRQLVRKMVANAIDKGLAAGQTNEQILQSINRTTRDALSSAATTELDKLINQKRNGTQAPQTIQTAPQGQTDTTVPAAAEPVVDERQAILQKIFGQRNGDIIFDVVGMGMPEPEAAAKYGLSRQAIQKIAGATGQKTWPERIARAKTQFGLTNAQIAEAFNISAADQDVSEVERDIFGVGAAPDAISETEAIEAGLENIVKTAGAGTSEVEGFTKLQREIDATLEALATETDPAVLAELNATLAAQIEKVKAVEKKAQAEVRRTAGRAVEPITEGETDAVQVESPAGVSVQPKAEAGQGVGKQVRSAKKPAAESKAQATQEQIVEEPTVQEDVATLDKLKAARNKTEKEFKKAENLSSGDPRIKAAKDKFEAAQEKYTKFLSEAGARSDKRLDKRETTRAAESKAQVPAVILTEAEQAAQAWDVVAADFPQAPKFADLTKDQQQNFIEFGPDNWTKDDVETELIKIARTVAPTQRKLTNEPFTIDVEARVIDETVGPQIVKLPAPQVTRLENHYGVKQGTPEFLAKVKADVVLYATKGAEAVAGAIRDIIKAIHAGVLSVAMIFNPTSMSQLEAFVVIPQKTQTTTQQVLAELPAEVTGMSDAGKQAYATLIPALKGKIGDKFITIADKPSGRIFVFKANGDLVLQKKALFGLAKGDLYKGNNDLPQNRVTPAGLFGIKVIDAAKGGGAAKTAGDYDFGKVFALEDPDAVVTFMHSVWLKEKDAPKRAAALQNDSAADSRYSFGCINVDKETFKDMVGKYSGQMDGSKLFVVPDAQNTVSDFIAGTVADDRLVREGVQPVTKTITTPVKSATQTAGVDRTVTAREEKVGGMKFGKEGAPIKQPYTAKQLLAELKDFIRADIPGRKLMVVDSVADLLTSSDEKVRAVGAALQLEGAYGVAVDGRAYLIADRIKQGSGRAKFMHEVGAHLGLENLLPTAVYDKLVNQLEKWAKSNNNSLEAQLAAKAKVRVGYAGTPTVDEREELLAYFVEEAMLAGVDPTAMTKESGPLTAWFRTLWAAFKVAVRRLGFKPETLKAQDIVNMAFGAARLEMTGSWHGTAATFRKFNHAFMSSGEGAQAYGWGTYLAQNVGIAKDYWLSDIKRKKLNSYEESLAPYYGYTFAGDIINPGDGTLEVYAGFELTKNSSRVVASRLANLGVDYVELASPDGKVTTVQVGGPSGNLMRVDTAVPSNKMIDWDASFAEQPQVVVDFIKNEAPNIKALRDQGVNVQITSGVGIIRYLTARFYKEGGYKGPWVDADPVIKTAVKEKASKYLEANGIQGIQFFDATSREHTLDNISFTKNEKTISGRDGVLQAYFTPGAIVQGYGGPDKVIKFEPVKQLITVIAVDNSGNPRRGERERTHSTMPSVKDVVLVMQQRGYDLGTSNRTRNLVIFNENNIFRAGSEAAADRQRMKFGKNMPAQGLINRNIARLPKMAQQPVKRITEALGDLGGAGLDYVVFTSDLVKRAVAAGLPAAQTFSDRLALRSAKVSEEERKIEKIADRYASIENDAKGSGPGSVNEFLFESTRTGKWGYGKFRDAKMGAAFDALGPKAQQFVKDVFAHGDATLSNKKKIVLDAANSEYDAMIKAAQDAGDKDSEAKLKAEKAATLKRFQTLFRIREGIPYAPIKRTGSYVVIGESAEYKAAKAKKDTATIKKLESDPDHYHVSFVDTKWQARSLRDRLAEQGVFTDPQVVSRSESFDEAFSGEAMLPALTKMRAAVDRRAQDSTGKKDPTAGKLLNIINQLYLEALAEGSARKSEMRRRGVAGEVDMLQSFTQQGRADANFLASVEFEPKIQDALQQMRNQSRTGDRERKSEIFDELTKRYSNTLDPQPSPFINGLTNMASKFFLASSPGYYLQNLTQPFMMSLPAMAGRHDYTKAAAELAKAYGELGPLFKDVKLFDEQFDFSKVPADVRAAINELVNQGKIDIGLATEINEYKVEADNKLGKFAQRLNKGMRLAVQKVEATNRLSTAIAAYRLEFARTKDAAKATQYAADILTDTHGDYTSFNAPRAFNSQWGKVALQFRKFQLIQIAFYAKLIRDAFTNPAERAAAMKTLAYSLSHTAVFAGMMGLPGYAAISAILGFFGDEDEPFDLTAEMRKAIGPEWADMIMRGAPTIVGMDLSGKIGAGNMLSIMPFSDADLSTNAGRAEALGTLIGGAAFGMTSRIIDGLNLIANGDYYKGVERVMPKGVSDALKAGRQAAEGMTRRNGDVVLPDSEINALDTVFTALGVPAVKQAVTYERQNRMRDITENFNDRTTRIKNDYTKAARERDTAAMAEARTAWTKLQQARQRNGLTAQPVSNLLKAPQEQRAREQRTVGGVQYREGQRKLAESVAAD